MSGTTELVHQFGVTYRQIDYWIRSGYIPGLNGDDGTPGSGCARQLALYQVDHIRVMVRLVNDGVTPKTAARLACALSKGRPTNLGGFVVTA